MAGVSVGCAPLPHRDWQDDDGVAIAAVVPSSHGFAPANATPERRVDTADRVWRTILERYYLSDFHGIDVAALRARAVADAATVANDEAFYKALSRGVDAMGDSHTGLLTPGRVEERRTGRGVRFGIGYDLLEGRVVVVQVEAGSATEEAGIRVGMIIEAIDDVALDASFVDRAVAQSSDDGPIDEATRSARAADAVVRLFVGDGPDFVAHRIALIRGDDSRFETRLVPRSNDLFGKATYRTLPSGIGVLRVPSLENASRPSIAEGVDAARAAASALIIDLRYDPGGTDVTLRALLNEFVDRPKPVLEFLHRPALWYWPDHLSAEPVRQPFARPLAVLVDPGTASAAELAALVLVEQRGALVIGGETCGCVVGVIGKYVLPDGGALQVAEIGFESVKGRRLEGDPLRPDLSVRTTLDALRAGRDVVVEAAERALLNRIGGAAVEP